jgi:simple sugar transport system permease protein
MRVLAPLIAALLTLLIGAAFFASLGQDPVEALHAFFIRPLATANGVSEWLLKASPLILIACGLAVGFRANVWNIGAEGQLVMGAVAATGVGLYWTSVPESLLLPAMFLAGAVAGMGLGRHRPSCARG